MRQNEDVAPKSQGFELCFCSSRHCVSYSAALTLAVYCVDDIDNEDYGDNDSQFDYGWDLAGHAVSYEGPGRSPPFCAAIPSANDESNAKYQASNLERWPQ